jgi:mannosyltransferase OCH1-like enzyme
MIKTYKDLKSYKIEHDGKIPKIVFRTGKYKVEDLPKEVVDLYENEMHNNPDYTLFYFDNKDCEEFIFAEYKEKMFECYDQLIPSAFRADFWRYLILYKYGGLYLDFTMHSLVPFDEIIKNYKQVYVRDTCDLCGIYNAFIASIPNATFIKVAIEKVIENIKNKYKGVNSLDVTGPTMLGRIFKNKLNLYFYDWIPLGEMDNGIYLYSNPANEFIVDGDKHVIKNRLDNHYELAYDQKPHPLLININNEIKPLNHYSRLWSDDKIYKN